MVTWGEPLPLLLPFMGGSQLCQLHFDCPRSSEPSVTICSALARNRRDNQRSEWRQSGTSGNSTTRFKVRPSSADISSGSSAESARRGLMLRITRRRAVACSAFSRTEAFVCARSSLTGIGPDLAEPARCCEKQGRP
jgi:hypothetical protein